MQDSVCRKPGYPGPGERQESIRRQGAAAFDLSQPIYGIVTPNEYLCVIARVKDVDKVKDALSHFECKRIVVDEYDGREWAWLSDGWLASWDGRSFICVGPGVTQERDVLRQNDYFDDKFGQKIC